MEKHELHTLFERHGFADFRWIDPKEIVVAEWVRMKCVFGCASYGKVASCPPNLPSVSDCRRFFDEYEAAVLFHFEKALDDPEERHRWAKGINLALLGLEREVFLAGYQKAFLLFIDNCSLCAECATTRATCKNPRSSRPTPEGLAVDVFATVRKHGLPISVLADFRETMNRYAILLVE